MKKIILLKGVVMKKLFFTGNEIIDNKNEQKMKNNILKLQKFYKKVTNEDKNIKY